ncbi:signal peptidase I [Isoptericola sp. NPDC057191]|uniref:signal peptidase I n=1 Tax=Isoptericola sp. NPDC057191 TaxID=3346041 RepID=UPI00362C508B
MTARTAPVVAVDLSAVPFDQARPADPAVPAGPAAPARGLLRTVASAVLGVVMVAALALAGAAVAVPKLVGATPLTVLTGSMEPALSPGDVVVVRPVDPADVRVGDVVTFQPVSGDPTLVTHRVAGVTWGTDGAAGFVTRGDANGADDDPIVSDQVQGRVMYSIPWLGHLTNASWGPTAVKIGAVALILYGVVMVVTPDRSRRTDRHEESS